MRRSSKSSSPKLSNDSQRLIDFAQGATKASSRLEERTWQRSLNTLLNKMLKSSHQEDIDDALEHLFKIDIDAYDSLLESVEAMSESCVIEYNGSSYDALLIAAPIL